MEQFICPVCAARMSPVVSGDVANCKYCGNEFLIQSSRKLGDLDELMCNKLNNLRVSQSKAVESNDIGILLSSSQDILGIVVDDYLSNYYFAYASNARGQNKYLTNFYTTDAEPATKGDMTKILTHIGSYSDLRDRVAIERYIMNIDHDDIDSFEALNKYKQSFATRKALEENYDIVQRDVFVCHRSTDRAVVEGVVSALERDGHKCWVSYRNLRPNDTENYWDNISSAIENSSIFLVISSTDCMLSGDCKSELKIAKSKGKARLEYKIDNEPHTSLFKDFFDGIQWVDGTADSNHGLANLCHRVYAELENLTKDDTQSDHIEELRQMIASQQSVQPSGGVNIASLLKAARVYTSGGEFSKARELLDKIAESDIECAEMWWLKLLCECKANNDDVFALGNWNTATSVNYNNAILYASAEQKKQWSAVSASAKNNYDEVLRQKAKIEREAMEKNAKVKKKMANCNSYIFSNSYYRWYNICSSI